MPGRGLQGAQHGRRPRPAAAARRSVARRAAARAACREEVADIVTKLIRARRVLEVQIAGEKRLIAVEDAARYRDALGVPLPPGLPTAFLRAGARRHAGPRAPLRAHARAVHDGARRAQRFGLPLAGVESTLQRLVRIGPRASRADSGPAACIASGATSRCCGRSGASRWRACARKWSRSSSGPGAAAHAMAGRGAAATRARRAAGRRSRTCRARRCQPRILETEILPARIAQLPASRPRHADRRGRSDVGRLRAARRARRPRRALPGGEAATSSVAASQPGSGSSGDQELAGNAMQRSARAADRRLPASARRLVLPAAA